MQLAAILLVVAATAAAQTLISACLSSAVAIPGCGIEVLISIASSYGCGATDFACQCAHQLEIQPAATLPVVSACNIQTGYAVEQSALALCSCVSAQGGKAGNPAATGGSSPGSANAAKTTAAATSAIASSKAGTSVAAAQTSAAQSSAASSPALSPSSKFKGAAATADTFAPVGGLIGMVAGLVAYL